MKLQQSKKLSKNRITLILGVLVLALAISIVASLYLTGTTMTSNGSMHSSSSPFSPLINKDTTPYNDFASLAKQIEQNQKGQ